MGDSFKLLDQHERIHEGQLSWWRWLAQTGHRTPQISGVIDQGAKRPVCSIETEGCVRQLGEGASLTMAIYMYFELSILRFVHVIHVRMSNVSLKNLLIYLLLK